MSAAIGDLLSAQFRFLLFRPILPDLKRHFWSYFVFVLLITWVVGIGRYWDHPNAQLWQYAGLGSVVYIFVLSTILYLIVAPLRPSNWRYSTVLVFVGLTSLPALLYAFPIERFVELRLAKSVNAWFLVIVAMWRVSLLVKFLLTGAKLGWFSTIVATILPLSAIVTTLAVLNLEHVVFDLMAGIRPENASPYDTAYVILVSITVLAFYTFPVAAVCYVGAIIYRRRKK